MRAQAWFAILWVCVAPFFAQVELESPLDRAMHDHAEGRAAKAVPLYKSHLEAHPEDAKAWFLLARAKDDLGESDEVRKHLATARRLDPKNAELFGWELLYALEQGDAVEESAFAELGGMGPSDVTHIAAFARIQLSYEFPDPAIPHITRIVDQFGELGYLRSLYQRLVAQVENLEFDVQAIDLEPGTARMNWDPWSRDLLGRATTPRGVERWTILSDSFGDHASIVTRLVDANVDPAELTLKTRERVVGVLSKTGQFERALAFTTKLIELGDTDPLRYIEAATFHRQLKREDRFAKWIQRAIDEAPDDPRVLLTRAQEAIRLQDFAAGRRILDELLTQHPNDRRALSARARLNQRERQPESAARDYERIIERAPWDTMSFYQAVQSYTQANRLDDAKRLLALASKLGAEERMTKSLQGLIDNQSNQRSN